MDLVTLVYTNNSYQIMCYSTKTLELNDNKTFLSRMDLILNMQTILHSFSTSLLSKEKPFCSSHFSTELFLAKLEKIGVLGSLYWKWIVGLCEVRKNRLLERQSQSSFFNGFYFPIARLQCDSKVLFLLHSTVCSS